MLTFYKYQGTGNDFIFIDNRTEKVALNGEEIKSLCNRRLGIGADGLILLQNDDQADFRMVYFNADGRESSMCGNGGRCAVHFAYFLDIISRKCTFMAIDGLHQGEVVSDNRIRILMSDVDDIRIFNDAFVMNTGSPHYVTEVKDLATVNVEQQGRSIRNSEPFKEEGINVNFVKVNEQGLEMATYERGVENETLSCGTGVTAAALMVSAAHDIKSPIRVSTKGGDLSVSFEKSNESFTNIWLEGPVSQVYRGIL